MDKSSPVVIIGAGIVGCSIAYELATNGFTDITVVERNASLLDKNQSTTNEGTIHAGVYYPKSIMPLKAKLCVEGNTLLYEFLAKHNLPHKKVGKMIIATNKDEEAYLDYFLRVGQENGVPGVRKITGEEALRMEPNLANITQALYVPSTGSTSPLGLLSKMNSLAKEKGVVFSFSTKVITIQKPENNLWSVVVESEGAIKTLQAQILINAAGLYSDEIAKMVNKKSPYSVEPARGEFFQFDKSKRENIWMNGMHVYQPPYCYITKNGTIEKVLVPIDQLEERLASGEVTMTAGVHLSPSYDLINDAYVFGNAVTISPLKTTGLGKEDYTTNLHSAKEYIQRVHYFFPNLKEEDVQADHTGIMSPLQGHRDFVIEKDTQFPSCINLIGMESPAWTACLAIAAHVRALLT